jgi:hypothetical protein
LAICSCGLPAHCCQPAVAGGVIYADLWGELNTHLALQALFTQSSPMQEPLLSAFPFPSTLRVVTLNPLSLACIFIYSSCGKWFFPTSCGVFLPPLLLQAFLLLIAGRCCCSCQLVHLFTGHVEFSYLHHSHKLPTPGCWAHALAHARACPARPGLFIYSSGKDSPPPLFSVQCTPTSLKRVFIVLIAYYSVSLFSLGGGRSVQGAMLFWTKVVCGSTMYC